MRSAITILSLVAAIAAEAPYNLPRPAANAPAFHYPTAPAPPPPPPPRPIPQFAPQPAPQPFISNFGYQYQQPSFGPAFVQHAPAPAPAPVPIPQPIQYQPQPQTAYLSPVPHLQPIAYSQPPQPQPIAYQPPSTSYGIPQPNIVSRPILSQPQGEPIQLFRAAAPQSAPFPQSAPQPAPILQSAPQPQPITQFQPQPILRFQPQPIPQFQPQPIPQFQTQPIPQPQSAQVYQPIHQPQFNAQQGYSYQQPQTLPQHLAQVPLQAQPLTQTASVLSSYQADSNQYSSEQAQTHREALDAVVVDRVQNVIKDDEHSSARNAGYQSLVSGVSLENARPSVEITSFVHTSPLNTDQISVSQSSSGASGTLAPSLSADYGLPSSAASTHSSESASSFLPHTHPATSYGPPN